MHSQPTHAGGLVYRDEAGCRKYLVVQASRGDDWVLPKGHIERGESPAAAAVRELVEEAGVVAEIVAPLDLVEYRVGREEVRVLFFLMRAVGATLRHEGRGQEWLCYREAHARLTFPETRRIVEKAGTEHEGGHETQ